MKIPLQDHFSCPSEEFRLTDTHPINELLESYSLPDQFSSGSSKPSLSHLTIVSNLNEFMQSLISAFNFSGLFTSLVLKNLKALGKLVVPSIFRLMAFVAQASNKSEKIVSCFILLAKARLRACSDLVFAVIYAFVERKFQKSAAEELFSSSKAVKMFISSISPDLEREFLQSFGCDSVNVKKTAGVLRSMPTRLFVINLNTSLETYILSFYQVLRSSRLPLTHSSSQEAANFVLISPKIFSFPKLEPFLLLSLLADCGSLRRFVIDNLNLLNYPYVSETELLLSSLVGFITNRYDVTSADPSDGDSTKSSNMNSASFFEDESFPCALMLVVRNRLTKDCASFSKEKQIYFAFCAFIDIAILTCMALDYLSPAIELPASHEENRSWLCNTFLNRVVLFQYLALVKMPYQINSVITHEVHSVHDIQHLLKELTKANMTISLFARLSQLVAAVCAFESLCIEVGMKSQQCFNGRSLTIWTSRFFSVIPELDSVDLATFINSLNLLVSLFDEFCSSSDLLEVKLRCSNGPIASRSKLQAFMKFLENFKALLKNSRNYFTIRDIVNFTVREPEKDSSSHSNDSDGPFDVDEVVGNFVRFCLANGCSCNALGSKKFSHGSATLTKGSLVNKELSSLHARLKLVKSRINGVDASLILSEKSRIDLSDDIGRLQRLKLHYQALDNNFTLHLSSFI